MVVMLIRMAAGTAVLVFMRFMATGTVMLVFMRIMAAGTAVILFVLTGGAAAGMAGILLSVPLVLCLRAALRVMVLYIPVKS